MNYLYITTQKDAEIAWKYFSAKEFLGVDIETGNVETGLPEFEPWKGDISLFQMSDGEKTVVIKLA